MVAKHENVKWVDGLRGLASLSVVITHLARAFHPVLFYPNIGPLPDNAPLLLQWPVIRVFIHGRIGIAIFALVTGYVCALKPIRQSRAGNIDGALASVAKSAFRRIPRLFLPTTIATVLMWLIALCGAFEVSRHSDSFWLSSTSPEYEPTWSGAVMSLLREILMTWTQHSNTYDPNQWTLQPLLKGSMMIYMIVVGTIYVQQRYRMWISIAFCIYFFLAGEVTFNMQFFFGMLLSDMSNHQPSLDWVAARPWVRRLVPPILIVAGLWLASYPEDHTDWAPWSMQLETLGSYILLMAQEPARFFTGFGMDLICLAIYCSPSLKNALSTRPLLWLGRNSFAVYLLHGTLIRTLLAWCMYGLSVPAQVEQEVEGHMEIVDGPQLLSRPVMYEVIFIPAFFVLLYGLANLWTAHVDPLCARLTAWLERASFNEAEKMQPQGLLSQPPA